MDSVVLRNLAGRQICPPVPIDCSTDEPLLPRLNLAITNGTGVGLRVSGAVDDWSAGTFEWGPLVGLWEIAHEGEVVPEDQGPSWATHIFTQTIQLQPTEA